MEFINGLYYFIGIVYVFIFIMLIIFNDAYQTLTKDINKFNAMNKKNTKLQPPNSVIGSLILLLCLWFPYIFWLVLGVFTFQWPLYFGVVFLVLFTLFFRKLFNVKSGKPIYIYMQAQYLLCTIFLIINGMHLKIDLFKMMVEGLK